MRCEVAEERILCDKRCAASRAAIERRMLEGLQHKPNSALEIADDCQMTLHLRHLSFLAGDAVNPHLSRMPARGRQVRNWRGSALDQGHLQRFWRRD
jgi:hypothetical protein